MAPGEMGGVRFELRRRMRARSVAAPLRPGRLLRGVPVHEEVDEREGGAVHEPSVGEAQLG